MVIPMLVDPNSSFVRGISTAQASYEFSKQYGRIPEDNDIGDQTILKDFNDKCYEEYSKQISEGKLYPKSIKNFYSHYDFNTPNDNMGDLLSHVQSLPVSDILPETMTGSKEGENSNSTRAPGTEIGIDTKKLEDEQLYQQDTSLSKFDQTAETEVTDNHSNIAITITPSSPLITHSKPFDWSTTQDQIGDTYNHSNNPSPKGSRSNSPHSGTSSLKGSRSSSPHSRTCSPRRNNSSSRDRGSPYEYRKISPAPFPMPARLSKPYFR